MYDAVDRTSFFIVLMACLIGDMARGVLFPTLYMNVVRLGGSKEMQGIAVASFSMGRVFSSPIFGTLSERHGHRWILVVCAVIIAVGCVQYCYAATLASITVGQFVTGAGAGSLGVTRSYVVECAKEKRQRTVYLAHLNAVQYLGFTVMPIMGSVMAVVGERYPFQVPWLHLDVNTFTLPALFMAALSAANALLLCAVYVEPSGGKVKRTKSMHEVLGTSSSTHSLLKLTTSTRMVMPMVTPLVTTLKSAGEAAPLRFELDVVDEEGSEPGPPQRPWSHISNGTAVAITGYLLTVTTKGTIGVYETLGAEFALSRFEWDSVRTGYTFALCGALGVACLMSFDRLVAWFDDTDLALAGIACMTVASMGIVGSAGSLGERGFYASLVLMYAVGYPLGHTAVLGMVSKIADAGPQGTRMGWLAAAGSLARIIFPLLAGFLSELYDDTYIFALMAFLLLLSVVFCAAMRATIKAACLSRS